MLLYSMHFVKWKSRFLLLTNFSAIDPSFTPCRTSFGFGHLFEQVSQARTAFRTVFPVQTSLL